MARKKATAATPAPGASGDAADLELLDASDGARAAIPDPEEAASTFASHAADVPAA